MEHEKFQEDYEILYKNENSICTEPELITKLVSEGEFKTRYEALNSLRTYWQVDGYYMVEEISDAIRLALARMYR